MRPKAALYSSTFSMLGIWIKSPAKDVASHQEIGRPYVPACTIFWALFYDVISAPAGAGRYKYRAPCPRLIGSCFRSGESKQGVGLWQPLPAASLQDAPCLLAGKACDILIYFTTCSFLTQLIRTAVLRQERSCRPAVAVQLRSIENIKGQHIIFMAHLPSSILYSCMSHLRTESQSCLSHCIREKTGVPVCVVQHQSLMSHEEAQRLSGILASFPTTEAEDLQLLQGMLQLDL